MTSEHFSYVSEHILHSFSQSPSLKAASFQTNVGSCLRVASEAGGGPRPSESGSIVSMCPKKLWKNCSMAARPCCKASISPVSLRASDEFSNSAKYDKRGDDDENTFRLLDCGGASDAE